MNNKTKLILTAIGIAAILVPAVLLYFFTSIKPSSESSNSTSGSRQINKANIEKEVNSSKSVQPAVTPTPIPTVSLSPSSKPKASPTANPLESTSSSQ